jgi:hypothetical protein
MVLASPKRFFWDLGVFFRWFSGEFAAYFGEEVKIGSGKGLGVKRGFERGR